MVWPRLIKIVPFDIFNYTLVCLYFYKRSGKSFKVIDNIQKCKFTSYWFFTESLFDIRFYFILASQVYSKTI